MLTLYISRWKTNPNHYYGTVRTESHEIVQEILQCATRERVIEIAKEWAGDREMKVTENVAYF